MRVQASLAILGLLLLPLLLRNPYYLYLAVMVWLYAILALTAILPIGFTGQLILCQGAFWGIGAYGYALLTKHLLLSGWAAIPVAILVSALLGGLIALPALRTRGIYLGIVTLAFGIVFQLWLINANRLTGGTAGMYAPRLSPVLGVPFATELAYYYLTLLVLLGLLVGTRRLLRSPVGLALQCIRQNEPAAEAIGINTRAYRLLAFTLTAAIGGLAGGLFAPFNGFLSPTLFGFEGTLGIILAGVLGGIDRITGGIAGGAVLVALPELLRAFADFRVTIYGLSLILLLLFLPSGITPLLGRLAGGRGGGLR